MGHSRRKLNQLKVLYSKQLKKPVKEVIKLMHTDFTDDEFILKFRRCYKFLWIDLQKEQWFYQHKNKKFKGNKPLLFPSPGRMVLNSVSHLLEKARSGHSTLLTEEQKISLEERLLAICKEKLEKREAKYRHNTKLLQNIVPNYASSMIQSYFFLRHYHREDISGRYYALNEIAKFNNKRFIGFFVKVMATDRNNYCRDFAFQTLQKWNIQVHLPKKPKGKRHPSDIIKPVIPTSPDELISLMERLQQERDKSYNIFISHSYSDRELIIKIKDILNRQNLSVYVDWMIDKDGLPREKLNDKTWATLEVRMLHCNCLLYVHTKNCYDSNYIKKELHFAEQKQIPIFVLNMDDSIEPEGICPTLRIKHEAGKLFVLSENKELPFEKWIP